MHEKKIKVYQMSTALKVVPLVDWHTLHPYLYLVHSQKGDRQGPSS